jgi:hypothetical protein
VQGERIDVPAQRGDDERYALHHQAGNERNIARQTIELGHSNRALGLLRRLQCPLQLRSAVERIGTLAGLDLGKLGDHLEALRSSEGGDRLALRFKTEAGAALLLGGRAIVGNEG